MHFIALMKRINHLPREDFLRGNFFSRWNFYTGYNIDRCILLIDLRWNLLN